MSKRKLEDDNSFLVDPNTPAVAQDSAADEQAAKRQRVTPADSAALQQLSTTMQQASSQLPVIQPKHAQWFKPEVIHEIEKRALPEFFNGKSAAKTPDTYKQIRTFMIQAFKASPSAYLTVTECRKVLSGDVCAIMRVHAFLEHWGLINYGIDPRNRTPLSAQGSSSSSITSSSSSSNPYINQALQGSASSSSSATTTVLHDYTREPSSLGERLVMLGSKPNTKTLFKKLQDLHQQMQQQSLIDAQTSDWTDGEVMQLIEAIDTHKDNWDMVAQRVGSKTREQCIAHFLQLPIEDRFLNPSVEITSQLNEDGTPKLDQPLPFADATNPVMALVAFLASTVNPQVAAAAAKSALYVLTDEIKKKTIDGSAAGGENKNLAEQIMSSNIDVSTLDVKAASQSALNAAVVRAKQLAAKEEREIQRYVAFCVEQQFKKLDLKMKEFDRLEEMMVKERESLAAKRDQIMQEKEQYKFNKQ